MTEKEKMLKEQMYNPNKDEELIKEREYAKERCKEYNSEKNLKILKKYLIK